MGLEGKLLLAMFYVSLDGNFGLVEAILEAKIFCVAIVAKFWREFLFPLTEFESRFFEVMNPTTSSEERFWITKS